jgi:hypothetical protein
MSRTTRVTPRASRRTTKRLALAAPIVLPLAAFCGDATPAPQWFKGNTHMHSLWSDGDNLPELAGAWYKDHGYAFVVMSDHNSVQRGERWSDITTLDAKHKLLDRCTQRFGDGWSKTRHKDGKLEVRLKEIDEYRGKLDDPGKFLVIDGEEISHKGSVHLNTINVAELIDPRIERSPAAALNASLDDAAKAAKKSRWPAIVTINHPNFCYALTAEDLIEARGARFVEVANAHPLVRNDGDAVHPPLDRLWDIANAVRLAQHKLPPLFGVASDDAHRYHEAVGPVPGQAWIMVRARELTAAALIEAMQRGDFYATTGVVLKSLDYDAERRTLSVEVEPADGVEYAISFIGTPAGVDTTGQPVAATDKDGKPLRVTQRYADAIGRTLATTKGTRATYTLTGTELYVRAVVTTNQPSKRADLPIQAWTQPVGWEKRVAGGE